MDVNQNLDFQTLKVEKQNHNILLKTGMLFRYDSPLSIDNLGKGSENSIWYFSFKKYSSKAESIHFLRYSQVLNILEITDRIMDFELDSLTQIIDPKEFDFITYHIKIKFDELKNMIEVLFLNIEDNGKYLPNTTKTEPTNMVDKPTP